MNYRHAFHAGGFADVVKHAVLARILVHLAAKPSPFRVIDTHAGAGLYDLCGAEASRTGEAREGIGRFATAETSVQVRELLRPYLDTVASLNRGGQVTVYPGSPLLALALIRPQDRLIACELEPVAARALGDNLRDDERAKALAIDGWTALGAFVPPKERRGVALIDPAFEDKGEFTRLVDALAAAHRKWSSGIFVLWYPIKDGREPAALARRLTRLGMRKILRAELMVAPLRNSDRLNGSGLIIVNPPWKLESELTVMLPALAGILAREGKGGTRVDWLAGET